MITMTRKELPPPPLAVPHWGFEPLPAPRPDFPWTVETELERLKNRLLRAALAAVNTPGMVPGLRRAANEAAALAWLEPYPLLTFPCLFQELALAAQRRAHKQMFVRARSEALIAEAA